MDRRATEILIEIAAVAIEAVGACGSMDQQKIMVSKMSHDIGGHSGNEKHGLVWFLNGRHGCLMKRDLEKVGRPRCLCF